MRALGCSSSSREPPSARGACNGPATPTAPRFTPSRLRRPARSASLARPSGRPTAPIPANRRILGMDRDHLVADLPESAVQRLDQLPLLFPEHLLLGQKVFNRLHQ